MPQFNDFFSTTQVLWILVFIGVDVILGILGSFVKKDFRFGMVAAFMKKAIVGYVFGFVVLEMAAQALPQLAFTVPVAFLLVIVALLASWVKNLKKLGLVLPGANWM